jgi:hypothetical protein
MPARFDHLVVAVADLDEATMRWTDTGITASRGGALAVTQVVCDCGHVTTATAHGRQAIVMPPSTGSVWPVM